MIVYHQTTTKNKKNKNTKYRLQAKSKTSQLERKISKSLLFLIDSSIEKFQHLYTKTNTLQEQVQLLKLATKNIENGNQKWHP